MLYDIAKTYQENVEQGPCFSQAIPKRVWPAKEDRHDFLGYKVASRIGVPAGPLLTAEWTTLAARLGFDLVTYKTIRSHAYAGHPLPNVVYIDGRAQLTSAEDALQKIENAPKNMSELGITNSFGMPSQSEAFLEKDIAKALYGLQTGQVLIVSVVGCSSKSDFIQDFVDTALIAKSAGAPIVEANFSCPNVKTGEGSLYMNPDAVYEISMKLVNALKATPLILKMGIFPDEHLMRQAFLAAARAGVRAISGINTISKKVIAADGTPALGKDRLTSGICGAPIKREALKFISQARTLIDQEKLPLTLIGVGGIVEASDFDLFFNAGAEFAQTATGMMWNPLLAHEYHTREAFV